MWKEHNLDAIPSIARCTVSQSRFLIALRVYTEQDFPVQWAMTQNNLGTAYGNLPTGDRAENLRQSIACYQAALRGFEAANLSSEVERMRKLLTDPAAAGA